jgi:hypothetical protein
MGELWRAVTTKEKVFTSPFSLQEKGLGDEVGVTACEQRPHPRLHVRFGGQAVPLLKGEGVIEQ